MINASVCRALCVGFGERLDCRSAASGSGGECGGAVNIEEAISEDGPYMEKRQESQEGRLQSLGFARDKKPTLQNNRFCRVARLAASTRGDLAKRARFIVPLLVPKHCPENEEALKTKRESTVLGLRERDEGAKRVSRQEFR